VLGTHGRGIWILDNVNALQELDPEVLAREAHLFTVEPAEMIRYVAVKAQGGDMFFKGKNPPAGAILDYYLRDEVAAEEISLAVFDASGNEVQKLEPTRRRGVNRVVWDLRHPRLPDPVGEEPDEEGERPRGPMGPWVVPGTYSLRLTVRGERLETPVAVREDPRLSVPEAERRLWTETLLELGEMYREVNAGIERSLAREGERSDRDRATEKLLRELRRRVRILYGEILAWTGEPTDDQKEQVRFLADAKRRLEAAGE
jgi:hypothetical protein